MAENLGRGLTRAERTSAVTWGSRAASGQVQNGTWPPRYAGWACSRALRLQRTACAIQLADATGISRPNSDPSVLPSRSHDRQARGLRFLHSTANRAYGHKSPMKTPDFRDRLSAASAAKRAQLERARTNAEDPERQKRIEARSQIIAARNNRIAERERDRREAIAREVAARAVAEAAEAAAREAAR